MKIFYFNMIIILFFTGCTFKEYEVNYEKEKTVRYYDSYSKDDILDAAKLAFKEDSTVEYIVDSYRDRLEVTTHGVFFNILHHQDYVLEILENNCGTDVNLTIEGSLGNKKDLLHNSNIYYHNDVWDRIDYYLGLKNEIKLGINTFSRDELNHTLYDKRITTNIINPSKDMTSCNIDDEFKNGIIKDRLD